MTSTQGPPSVGDPARLRALRSIALLDTPAEESFDRLTRLATRVLGVPVALVSLVDEDRQFFKSQCGLPEPWGSRRETPLSHSFCQHAVELARPLVIEDAREHPLVRDNLAIPDLNVIAYLGIPLSTADGYVLGSFCAIDSRPRRWTEAEISLMTELAASVTTEIELRVEVHARREAEEERTRLVEELAQQQTRLLSIFMEAPAVIGVFRGPDHVVEMANPVFLRLAALRDVLGRPVREGFPEPGAAPFLALLDEVYGTGQSRVGTEFPLTLRGRGEETVTRFFNFVHQPLFSPEGEADGVLVHAVDVTEQVRTRQDVEKLAAEQKAILRHIADGVVVTGPDGEINFTNEAALRIHGGGRLGVGPAEYAEAYGLFTVDGAPYPPEQLPLARAVLHDETTVDAEWMIRRADGTEVMAQGSAAPVLDEGGRRVGAVLTLRDITAQRALERQRAELLDARDRAQRELAEALEGRSRFFTLISHELRTPINAVLGYSDLVLAGVYGPVSEGQREALEKSLRAARHLLTLVNDILDLSKLEAGRLDMQFEQTSLRTLVEDTISTVRPMAEEKGSALEVIAAGDIQLPTDPHRLHQVLLNLLSNAIKFGEGKPIRVEYGSLPDGLVEVSVADQGGGIAPEDVERIFEEFVQVGDGRKGTGLGLPISRRLAELLGGRLEVESAVGRGSRFRTILPIAGPPAAGPAGSTGR